MNPVFHWYQYIDDTLKLLIQLLTQCRAFKILNLVCQSQVSLWLKDHSDVRKSLVPPHKD
jgi:hypothetical protein